MDRETATPFVANHDVQKIGDMDSWKERFPFVRHVKRC